MRKVATKPSNTNKQTTNKRRKFILLVILLVSLSIFAYYYFRFINKTNDHNNINPTTNQPISTEPITNQTTNNQPNITKENIFKIPELGIQFVLPEGLEGLEYRLGMSTSGMPLVNFTTKDLVNSHRASKTDGVCELSYSYKYAALGSLYQIDRPPEEEQASRPITKKINGRYYAYSTPQQPCSMDNATNQIQSRQLTLLAETIETITEIK